MNHENWERAISAAKWVDRFFDLHFERHPVDATFVGLHDHDCRLPPIDSEGVEATVGAMNALLDEADRHERSWRDRRHPAGQEGRSAGGEGPIDVSGARSAGLAFDDAPFEMLDVRLARGFLRTRIWEYESGHVLGNPSAHVADAVFGLMSLLFPSARPLDERLDALRARMEAIPSYLRHARLHLPSAPAAWTRRALRECRGALAFLGDGLDRVDADLDDATQAARLTAANAFASFRSFLSDEVGRRPSDLVGCGPEALARYLADGHFLDRSAGEVVAYARDEMERTRAWLRSSTHDFGAARPDDVLAELAERHPSADAYLGRYQEVWDAMRGAAIERKLVTWPDFPIRYAPRPPWARAAAPDLYFLFYRSPAAFGRPEVHEYMVAPLDEGAGAEEREAFLRANNDSVIKLNHVIHHGGIGHHVQNWHAFRCPSRIGRIAAVDCASRIAMYCGGTMAEGWACYATDLMAEAGALTSREVFAEHHGRVRMCARAIVDVELHHGRMSLGEAAAFYHEHASMGPAAAQSEAVKNSMFPGAALMYLVGRDTIHELRSDVMRTLGERFDLGAFHDAFLSYGSIPVQLTADEIRRRAAAGLPLDAHAELPAGTPS